MNKLLYWFTLIFSVVCLSSAPPVQAVPLIATFGSPALDKTDYSDSGLNIGNSGFWFANFGASTPVTGRPLDNAKDSLPAWILPPNNSLPPDPHSFSPDAISIGGQSGYNILTLPDGTTGLSGQLVDVGVAGPGETGQSNTIIHAFEFGEGVPSSFLLHIVLDNDPPDSDNHVARLRVKHVGRDQNEDDALTDRFNIPTYNSIADVYSFRFDNVEVGNYFTVQLRTTDGPNTAMAGLMFDVIPEPSSLLLMILGAASIAWVVARRGGKRGHGFAY